MSGGFSFGTALGWSPSTSSSATSSGGRGSSFWGTEAPTAPATGAFGAGVSFGADPAQSYFPFGGDVHAQAQPQHNFNFGLAAGAAPAPSFGGAAEPSAFSFGSNAPASSGFGGFAHAPSFGATAAAAAPATFGSLTRKHAATSSRGFGSSSGAGALADIGQPLYRLYPALVDSVFPPSNSGSLGSCELGLRVFVSVPIVLVAVSIVKYGACPTYITLWDSARRKMASIPTAKGPGLVTARLPSPMPLQPGEYTVSYAVPNEHFYHDRAPLAEPYPTDESHGVSILGGFYHDSPNTFPIKGGIGFGYLIDIIFTTQTNQGAVRNGDLGAEAGFELAGPPVAESAAVVFDPPPPLDGAALDRVLAVADVTRAQLDELEDQSFVVWERHRFATGRPAEGEWNSDEWAARWASEIAADSIAALGLRELHYLLLAMGVAQDTLRKMRSRADKQRMLEALLPKCRAVVQYHLQRKNALNAAERAALQEQAEALIRTGQLDCSQEQLLWRNPIIEFGAASSASSASSSSFSSSVPAAALRPEGMDAEDWMDLGAVASSVIVRKEGVSVAMIRAVLESSPWVMIDAAGVRARRLRLDELRGNEFHMLTADEAVIGAHVLSSLAERKQLSMEDLLKLMQRELAGWSEQRVLRALRLNTALDASSATARFSRLTPEQQKGRIADFTLVPDCARPSSRVAATKSGLGFAPSSFSSASSGSGFSFGSASASAGSGSSQPYSFGAPMTLLSGSWECSACLLRNAAALRACRACETPRSNEGGTGFTAFGFNGVAATEAATPITFGQNASSPALSFDAQLSSALLPLPSVCVFRSANQQPKSGAPAPAMLGERAMYINPACAAGADPAADVPVTSSCSFSVRIRSMKPFNRLRIGFRQNSLFAQTHLLQLCCATEGASQALPGHGELYTLHNARRPRLSLTEPDTESLFESDVDDGPSPASLPLPSYSAPPVVAVDPAVPNASAYRVYTEGGVSWSVQFLPHSSVAPQPFRMQLLELLPTSAIAAFKHGSLRAWIPERVAGGVINHELTLTTIDDAKIAFVHTFNNFTRRHWSERGKPPDNDGTDTTWIDESDPSTRRFQLPSASSSRSASSIPAQAPVKSPASQPNQPLRTVAAPQLRCGSVITVSYDEEHSEIRFAIDGADLPAATIRSVLTRHAQPAGWNVDPLHAMIPIVLAHGEELDVECVAEDAGRQKAVSSAAAALSSLHQIDAAAMVAGSAAAAAAPPLRDLAGALSAWSAAERAASAASSSERDSHAEGLVPCASSALPGLLRLLFHDFSISQAIGLPYLSVSLIDLVTEYLQFSAPRSGTRQFGFMRFWALMLRSHNSRNGHYFERAALTVCWLFRDAFPFQTSRQPDPYTRKAKRAPHSPGHADIMSDAGVDDPSLCVYHDLVCAGLRSKLYSDPSWRALARRRDDRDDGEYGFSGERDLIPTEGDPEGYERMFVRFANKHPDQLRAEDYAAAERAKEEMVAMYGELDPAAAGSASSSDSSVAHAALLDRHFGGGVKVDEDGKWLGKVDFATPVAGGGFKVGSTLRFSAAVYGQGAAGSEAAAASAAEKAVPRTLDPSTVTFGSLSGGMSHFPLPPVGGGTAHEAEFMDQSCLKQMIRAAASPPSLAEVKAHLSSVCGDAMINANWSQLAGMAQQLIEEKFQSAYGQF